MSNNHAQDEVRRFDLGKLFTLALLIIILVILLLRGCQTRTVTPQAGLTATAPAAAQSTTPPQPTPTQPAPTQPAPQPAPTAVPPVAPRLTSPTAGATLNDSKVTLKGTGQPNSQVQILVGGKVVGEAQVGADGTWSFAADLGKPGSYDLSVQVVDASGKLVAASEKLLVTLMAPAPAIAAPALTFPSAADKLTAGEVTFKGTGTPGSVVELVVDGKAIGQVKVGDDGTWSFKTDIGQSGTHEVKLRALDAAGQVAAESAALSLSLAPATLLAATVKPAITSPAAGASLPGGEVTLAGTGAANDEIEVLDNGKVVGTVEVGADGQWRFAYKPGSGEHELSVRVKANPSAVSGALKVTVAAPAVLPVAGGRCVGPKGRIEGRTYVVGVCDTLTRIGQINGVSLEALLAANPQIKDPNLIYLGQVLQLPH